ncbi:PBSX family phage terminase large subunit [Alkalibacillus almallahensis]|uniref:PBSX family phage terminase large subunit n=1 Tax=Alkalibacillus almallahensis TaxID=1379154 RepID=UPI001420BAA4|nr:PBSX family phage terminase large subunit [Alkalibacillus almallahensis]NIK12862.1 PBSX family phage terminase large subunit [Alkalibacillus almallahensis]
MSKTIKLSPKQKQTVRYPFDHTLEVHEGTPRSGKTTGVHFRLGYYYSLSRDENHLVTAYNQEQAFRLFIDGDGTGLMHIFGHLAKIKHDEHGDHLEVHTPNGVKRIYYKGGAKANSVGAITGMSLGSVAFGEINLLNMGFIQECFRRTMAAHDRFHIADLNPPAPHDPVIGEVFEVQTTRWNHWTIHDNPIISEARKKEIYETLKKNPYLLDRDWFGKRVMPQGVIYSMFNMEEHTENTLLGKPYEMFFEADGGQSDATSVSCNIVTRYNDKFRLNRVAHYYHSGSDTGQTKAMSTYAKEIKEFIKWCTDKYQMRFTELFVDPACKSLREELHLVGLDTSRSDNNATDAKKQGGGIEVGIERAQNAITNGQFCLVENDEYGHYNFVKEIGMYVRDDNGNPVDEYNHAMDEFRYSINHFYKDYVI